MFFMCEFRAPQQCPYNGEVIGLECNSSKSCECLAPGVPVMCIERDYQSTRMKFIFCLLTIVVLAQHDLADFKCPTDRRAVALGCSNALHCNPYTTDPVDCVSGACCVKSNNTNKLPYPTSLICSNGGTPLVVGCAQSQQCLPFTNEPVACLQGICCTVPQKCQNGGRVVGLQCTTSESCVPLAKGCSVKCINGMCCTV